MGGKERRLRDRDTVEATADEGMLVKRRATKRSKKQIWIVYERRSCGGRAGWRNVEKDKRGGDRLSRSIKCKLYRQLGSFETITGTSDRYGFHDVLQAQVRVSVPSSIGSTIDALAEILESSIKG